MACPHNFYFPVNHVVDLLYLPPPPNFLWYICSIAICVENKQFLLHLLINTMRERTLCYSIATALATDYSITGKGIEKCPLSL